MPCHTQYLGHFPGVEDAIRDTTVRCADINSKNELATLTVVCFDERHNDLRKTIELFFILFHKYIGTCVHTARQLRTPHGINVLSVL